MSCGIEGDQGGDRLTPRGIYMADWDHLIRTVLPASAEHRRSIMNGLIVFLAVVGAAMAHYGHPGVVQETPEVAAARAAHFSAVAAAGGHVPAPAVPAYGAPSAPGVPADTPEVAAAKAAHFAALAKAGSPAAAPVPAYDSGAYSPAAYDSGAYNPAAYETGAYNPAADNSGAYNPAWDAPTPSWDAPTPSWNAPAPAWNAPAPAWNAPAPAWNAPAPAWNAPAPAWNGAHSGLPVDTPEVAAAKAAHLAAHQAAAHGH